MNKTIVISIFMTTVLCTLAIAEGVFASQEPLSDGQDVIITSGKVYFFTTPWRAPENKPYQFEPTDLSHPVCDEDGGYHWCGRLSRCVKTSEESCAFISDKQHIMTKPLPKPNPSIASTPNTDLGQKTKAATPAPKTTVLTDRRSRLERNDPFKKSLTRGISMAVRSFP